MKLRHIPGGTKLVVHEELQNRATSDEYEAVMRYYESDELIVVQCPWLYENYDRLNLGAKLSVSYVTETVVHTFTGIAKEKLRSNGLVMIEKLTDIEAKSRRQFDRDEIRIKVNVYGIPESKALSASVEKSAGASPDLADISFDISPGGLCIVTNTLLSSKHDPYYLIEFELTEKDRFLIPAKTVRKSNYPHTRIGRYDYGFQFLFDSIPEEKTRLTRAILSKKLMHR